jgi:small subunit ribosomal protein S4
MVRYTGPKNRIARRFGANIFSRARNPMLHKSNPPGMHGARRKKKSEFGLQMEEKQKLKAIYGMMTEKQLVKYFKNASRQFGNTLNHLLEQLECRLDNLVFRLKLAPTIFAAQQLVSHGHVLVNGKKVDRRSFQVKPGMIISIREKSHKIDPVRNGQTTTRELPPYLQSEGEFGGKLLMIPEPAQISFPLPVNVVAVCEFLAHST